MAPFAQAFARFDKFKSPFSPSPLIRRNRPKLPRIAPYIAKKPTSQQPPTSKPLGSTSKKNWYFPEVPAERENHPINLPETLDFYVKATQALDSLQVRITSLEGQLQRAREVQRLIIDADIKFRELAVQLTDALANVNTCARLAPIHPLESNQQSTTPK